MNITIKTVTSPFSFFCVAEDENNNNAKIGKDVFCAIENPKSDRIDLAEINHSQVSNKRWKIKCTNNINICPRLLVTSRLK